MCTHKTSYYNPVRVCCNIHMTIVKSCPSIYYDQVTSDVLSPPEMMRRTLLSAMEQSDTIPTSKMTPEGEVDQHCTTSLDTCT